MHLGISSSGSIHSQFDISIIIFKGIFQGLDVDRLLRLNFMHPDSCLKRDVALTVRISIYKHIYDICV